MTISAGGNVDSVNGKTGVVVLNKSDVGLGNVDNVRQYSTSNPPPYPVRSVDGATGAVVTNAVKTTPQSLSDTQKQQVRNNIGAGTSSFDGDYNSLTNKPTIPTKTSQLTNDANYITAAQAPVQSVNNKTGSVTLSAADVSAIPSTLTGTAGQVLTKTADGQEWKDVDIPTALPNPNALTFTGAATGTYDGSAPLEVEIPTVDDVLAALPTWNGGSY